MQTVQNFSEIGRQQPISSGTLTASQAETDTAMEVKAATASQADMAIAADVESYSYNLYALLAAFFLTGLDEDWLLAVQELKLTAVDGGHEQYVRHMETIKALIAAEPEEKLTIWQTEYTRLFLGPGQAPAYPYESLYRSPRRLLMQEITTEVRQVYLERGLVMAKLYTQPEDHLGVELEFLGYLQRKRLEEPQKSRVLAEVQREFIYTHLLTWMDDFAKDILTNTEEPLFREIAGLLQEFLVSEEKRLSTKI